MYLKSHCTPQHLPGVFGQLFPEIQLPAHRCRQTGAAPANARSFPDRGSPLSPHAPPVTGARLGPGLRSYRQAPAAAERGAQPTAEQEPSPRDLHQPGRLLARRGPLRGREAADPQTPPQPPATGRPLTPPPLTAAAAGRADGRAGRFRAGPSRALPPRRPAPRRQPAAGAGPSGAERRVAAPRPLPAPRREAAAGGATAPFRAKGDLRE